MSSSNDVIIAHLQVYAHLKWQTLITVWNMKHLKLVKEFVRCNILMYTSDTGYANTCLGPHLYSRVQVMGSDQVSAKH